MFRKARTIKVVVWYLCLLALTAILLPVILERVGIISASISLSVLQPILATATALITRQVTRGQHDRVRHKAEKSLIVSSVLSVWFVLYFLSGLAVTYVNNAVAVNWQTVVINLATFGVTAAALEYVRHGIMLLGGRRNVVWLGVIIGTLFSFQQISFSQFDNAASIADFTKITVSSLVPAFASSVLLTYLAFTAGLGSQLTYRLGVIAVMFVPPIIPKYDWYMTGIAWTALAVGVYIAIDRNRHDIAEPTRHHQRARGTQNIAFVIVMIALISFMTGAFSYRPQVIMSNSMKPVYERGAVVIVQKSSPMDVRVGDIVQYEATGHSTTHRVIAIDFTSDGSGKRVFLTQGDNSPSPDMPVQADQIVGIVRAQVPYVGYPSVWLKEFAK